MAPQSRNDSFNFTSLLNDTYEFINSTDDDLLFKTDNNCTQNYFNCPNDTTALTNNTCGNNNGLYCNDNEGTGNLNEFHIIKAVVLVAVTSVLLISVCRMVLQLFVRYTNVKQDK